MRYKAPLVSLLILLNGQALAANDAIGLKVGMTWWNDTSNSDELEASSANGYLGGISYDRTYDLSEETLLSNIRLELELTYTIEEIHGANPDGRRSPNTRDFGNGDEYLHVGSLMANVWPTIWETQYLDLDLNLELYGGGGLGGTLLHTLDDTAVTPSWQVGAGVLIGLDENWSVDVGYRYLSIWPTKIDGLEAEYDRHTALIGLRYSFSQ